MCPSLRNCDCPLPVSLQSLCTIVTVPHSSIQMLLGGLQISSVSAPDYVTA